jgi:hypothetical protein
MRKPLDCLINGICNGNDLIKMTRNYGRKIKEENQNGYQYLVDKDRKFPFVYSIATG